MAQTLVLIFFLFFLLHQPVKNMDECTKFLLGIVSFLFAPLVVPVPFINEGCSHTTSCQSLSLVISQKIYDVTER
ncbi:hypothetical protein McpAg1_06940 [Methanocorpusculaceae archaeon Ag1]|uniref:Uncharacterized protein n=1 Tax=Methanorbis furvi TaxID=3028299 RepID=A0AAE4SBG2_9EURY|nr:hypothetical protein [Methanocorpusculaceae archaeon Ag1]